MWSNAGPPDRHVGRSAGLSIPAPAVRLRLRGGKRPLRYDKVLWTVQGLLAGVFLFAGVMKLILPLEALAAPVPLPGTFMRFVGVAEIFGAVGLILPGVLRTRPELTPVAAAGLVIIMTGATVITLSGGTPATALAPLAIGLLSALVVHGRSRVGGGGPLPIR
jgi:uncharacterized membrane protein YphA (DoxX/SURF4 family)